MAAWSQGAGLPCIEACCRTLIFADDKSRRGSFFVAKSSRQHLQISGMTLAAGVRQSHNESFCGKLCILCLLDAQFRVHLRLK